MERNARAKRLAGRTHVDWCSRPRCVSTSSTTASRDFRCRYRRPNVLGSRSIPASGSSPASRMAAAAPASNAATTSDSAAAAFDCCRGTLPRSSQPSQRDLQDHRDLAALLVAAGLTTSTARLASKTQSRTTSRSSWMCSRRSAALRAMTARSGSTLVIPTRRAAGLGGHPTRISDPPDGHSASHCEDALGEEKHRREAAEGRTRSNPRATVELAGVRGRPS